MKGGKHMPATFVSIVTVVWTFFWNLATRFWSLIYNNWNTILNCCTLLTFIFGFVQWRKQNSLNRASYAKMMMDDIRNKKEVIDVLHVIEYSDGNVINDYWYNKSFHANKDIEAKFDRVFAYFDYLCYLKEKKIIEKQMCHPRHRCDLSHRNGNCPAAHCSFPLSGKH